MWRTGTCYRRDPGTRNDAENSKLPRPSIKAPSDYAGSLRTLFPFRRLRLLKLARSWCASFSVVPTELLVKPVRYPPTTLEFSCRPPRENRPVPQENPFATSRNPLNGAPILAAPRLNLLCSAATNVFRFDSNPQPACPPSH